MRPIRQRWAVRRRCRCGGPKRGEVIRGKELDALADALDLAKLTEDQFVQLLAAVHMLDRADAGVSVSAMSTQSLVDLIARASRKQLRAAAARQELRTLLLEELFRRMADHVVAEKTRHVDAVVEWVVTSGDAEPLRYQTRVVEGACETTSDPVYTPDVTITAAAEDVLRLAVSGNSRALSLLVTGKLKVRGDFGVAARFLGYFDIPKPRA